jgi:hypothetical protein
MMRAWRSFRNLSSGTADGRASESSPPSEQLRDIDGEPDQNVLVEQWVEACVNVSSQYVWLGVGLCSIAQHAHLLGAQGCASCPSQATESSICFHFCCCILAPHPLPWVLVLCTDEEVCTARHCTTRDTRHATRKVRHHLLLRQADCWQA